MTTPPSDPYGTPAGGDDDRPPSYPGRGEGPPNFPTPPPPYGQGESPTLRPEPPSSIMAAVKLMYVGAGLSLLSMLFSLAARDEIREQVIEQQQDLDVAPGDVDSIVNITVGSLVVVGLLAVALWIWMAYTNKRGLAWARIVATVLGGLNIAFTLFSLAQSTGLGIVLNFVSIALAGAILFLLYRPDSTAYYNAVSNMPRY